MGLRNSEVTAPVVEALLVARADPNGPSAASLISLPAATLRRLGRCTVAAFCGIALTPHPATAQDCSVLDWDDIRGFRNCLEQRGLDALSPWTLHHAASETSNPTIIRLLLDSGADPNTPDDRGRTPLHWGAQNRNPMVATHLLNAGADLHAGDNEGYTPLHIAAAWSGNGRVINLLLNRGADPVAESNDGRTPLHSALRYRAERGTVTVLIEAGAAAYLTPLQRAALDGDESTVESLLADGADPHAADRYGWRPLHYAVPFAGSRVVATLLRAGADPNARSVAGGTPLHLAASQASEELVSMLLRAGADPGAIDEDQKRTPLHYAAVSNTRPRCNPDLGECRCGSTYQGQPAPTFRGSCQDQRRDHRYRGLSSASGQ